jgi:hypothetical protein
MLHNGPIRQQNQHEAGFQSHQEWAQIPNNWRRSMSSIRLMGFAAGALFILSSLGNAQTLQATGQAGPTGQAWATGQAPSKVLPQPQVPGKGVPGAYGGAGYYGGGYGGYGYGGGYNPGGLGGPWSGYGVRPGMGFGGLGVGR